MAEPSHSSYTGKPLSRRAPDLVPITPIAISRTAHTIHSDKHLGAAHFLTQKSIFTALKQTNKQRKKTQNVSDIGPFQSAMRLLEHTTIFAWAPVSGLCSCHSPFFTQQKGLPRYKTARHSPPLSFPGIFHRTKTVSEPFIMAELNLWNPPFSTS